jgi:uncharacterized metal-binding protein YceD (DUF177 family)
MKVSYELVFGNLKIENHQFHYRLDKKFFDLFDSEESKDGEVDVQIEMERAAAHLDMHFKVNGWALCDCDVCLSEIRVPVQGEYYLHVKLTDHLLPDEAEIMYIDRNKYKMDLTQLLFEYTFLSLPYRKLCEESLNKEKCDRSFIHKVNEDNENETDPQWDKLKDLFKK